MDRWAIFVLTSPAWAFGVMLLLSTISYYTSGCPTDMDCDTYYSLARVPIQLILGIVVIGVGLAIVLVNERRIVAELDQPASVNT